MPVHFSGLTASEAQLRLEQFGKNQLIKKGKTPLWYKFLQQFTDLNVIILIVAGLISIIVAVVQDASEEMFDAYVILGIVVLNAVIGFMQEYKTERALEALKKLMTPHARVLRGGEEMQIDARDLVPGDILILAEGDKIPADAIVIESNEAKVEESALTGESVPVQKTVPSAIEDIVNTLHAGETSSLLEDTEREQKIFMGTSLVYGSAKAVVWQTGMQTEFGRIAELTVSTEKDWSPLQKELHHIGIFVGKVTIVLSTILFFVGMYLQKQTVVHSLLFAVSVAVAAVPEGLPATITIALALGVQRLAKKNAIVKQLSSVETLGSTTVICSDKTGTLTKNEMTVTHASLPSGYNVLFGGVGYEPQGTVEVSTLRNDNVWKTELGAFESPVKGDVAKMLQVVSVCNDAKLVEQEGKWQVLGDPTEGALLTAAQKAELDYPEIIRKKDFPFDSGRKMMSVLVEETGNSQHQLLIKGAPDEILERSTHILENGEVRAITATDKKAVMDENNALADQALRVLAAAYRDLDPPQDLDGLEKEDCEQQLVFVGLIGMIDPARPEVKDAVTECHLAGIRTIIITGDYGNTAVAIAREIGIVSSDDAQVITGDILENMSDEDLRQALDNGRETIFARVSPHHKMRVVDMLKQLGEVVAVTGDGVNDAPALKRADIGVAMGITGTDVAKEAANMILTDDSFATIVRAVREGRTIYKNLRKFVWYLFSCNIGELVTIFIAIILFIPSPLTAILILFINLGTDVLPALALGIDKEEPGIMEEKPRDPKARIMSRDFIRHFFFMGTVIGGIVLFVYLFYLNQLGWQWGQQLTLADPVYLHGITLAFATLAVIQMVNAFNARSETVSLWRLSTHRYLWGAVVISMIVVVLAIQLPFMQHILHTVPLAPKEWAFIVLVSMIVFIVEEVRKFLHGMRKNLNKKFDQ